MTESTTRAAIFERVNLITGRAHRSQYAVTDTGRVFRRFWVEPVIRFRQRADGTPTRGRWDTWAPIDGALPAEARATGRYTTIRR